MIKSIKKRTAQIVMGEYLLTFFLVTAVVTAMAIYFKRMIQGRIHDSRDFMINYVRSETSALGTDGQPYYSGELNIAYEPYYSNVVANSSQRTSSTERLLSGGSSGIYQKNIADSSQGSSESIVAPPKDAD